MAKVSLLLPCLNSVAYMEQCLASVCAQTLKDIEILVVDAGSTDGTLAIVQKFQDRDSRIRLVSSEKRSYGYQMNLGISQAVGEYIGVVETDDYIEPNMMEVLYRQIVGTDADYIKAKARAFYDDGIHQTDFVLRPFDTEQTQEVEIVNPSQRPALFVSDNFLWNGLYRRDFLQRFRFNETSGAAFQDVGVLYQIIHAAQKGIYLDKVVYHYRQSNGGASSFSRKGLNFVKTEYEALYDVVWEVSDPWRRIYYAKMAWHTINRFHFMSFGTFWEESEKSVAWLQKTLRAALQDGCFGKEDLQPWDWEELQIFLQDYHQLYEACRERLLKQTSIVRDAFVKLKRGPVIIFGCGAIGRQIPGRLRGCHIDFVGYCDNDEAKQGTSVENLPVYSLTEAQQRYPQAVFWVANKYHADSIICQLKENGVDDANIYEEKEPLVINHYTLQMLLQEDGL